MQLGWEEYVGGGGRRGAGAMGWQKGKREALAWRAGPAVSTPL